MISYNGTLLDCVRQASKDKIWDEGEREVLAKAADGIAAQYANLALMDSPDWDGTERGFKRHSAGAKKSNISADFWTLYARGHKIYFHAYETDRGFNIGVCG